MQISKRFNLIDDLKEEEFLNNQSAEGYVLENYDGKLYTFIESDEKYYYMVEYFHKELTSYEIKVYEKKGYSLRVKYDSKDKGYYYFFVSKHEVSDDDRNIMDRYELLLSSKARVDRFTSIIFLSTFSLFTYLYFKTSNNVYIIVLLLTVLLAGYFGYLYIETIKKVSDYSKILLKKEGVDIDGDNERRSE